MKCENALLYVFNFYSGVSIRVVYLVIGVNDLRMQRYEEFAIRTKKGAKKVATGWRTKGVKGEFICEMVRM